VVVVEAGTAGDCLCGIAAGLATLDVDVDLDLNSEFPRKLLPALGAAVVLGTFPNVISPTSRGTTLPTRAMPLGHLGMTRGGLSATPVAFTVSTYLWPMIFCDSKSRSQRWTRVSTVPLSPRCLLPL